MSRINQRLSPVAITRTTSIARGSGESTAPAIRSLVGLLAAAALLAVDPTPSFAQVTPPPLINYEGVLLDNTTGSPLSGSVDMVFGFHSIPVDPPGISSEILVDSHTTADVSGPVTVLNGLFNVALGSGLQFDGSGIFPNEPYESLHQVFRDFSEVWLEVRIDPGSGMSLETLSPRTRVISSAFALNSDRLDGKDSGDFLDTSPVAQTKTGNLTVSDLGLTGNDIFLSSGARLTSSSGASWLFAGNEDSDDLFLVSGDGSGGDGFIGIHGGSFMGFQTPGEFLFSDANSLVHTRLDATGNLELNGDLQMDGDLTVSGDQIRFTAPGALINATGLGIQVVAGDSDQDFIGLQAGNGTADGALFINGGGDFDLFSGNGSFSFHTAQGSVERARLDASGNLQIDGSLSLASGVTAASTLTVTTTSSLLTHLDSDNNNIVETADWCTNGTCSGSNQLMQLQANGNLRIGGVLSQNQFDLAESYLRGEPMEPGDVVRLDPRRKGAILLSAGTEDATVIGVVSERPGVVLGGAPFDADRLERMWGSDIREAFERRRPALVEAIARSLRTDHAAQEGASVEGGEAASIGEAEVLQETVDKLALEAFYAELFAPVALAGRVPVKVDAGFGAIAPGDALSPSPVPGVAMRADGRGPVVGIALEGMAEGRGKIEAFISRSQTPAAHAIDSVRRETAERISERTPDPVTGVHALGGSLQVVLDRDHDEESRLSVFRDGEHRYTGAEVFRVDERGNVFAKGSFRPNAMVLAELFPLSEPAEPGDVLALDPDKPGFLMLARDARDRGVIGVVPSDPGILLGSGIDRMLASDPELAMRIQESRTDGDMDAEARHWRQLESGFAQSHAAVAMSGTVLTKADAGYGAIRAGDLLTASPTRGHAMRSDDPMPGSIIGKAIESLESGTGVIRIVVMLR